MTNPASDFELNAVGQRNFSELKQNRCAIQKPIVLIGSRSNT